MEISGIQFIYTLNNRVNLLFSIVRHAILQLQLYSEKQQLKSIITSNNRSKPTKTSTIKSSKSIKSKRSIDDIESFSSNSESEIETKTIKVSRTKSNEKKQMSTDINPVMKRDESISSLHGIGKLLHAKLDYNNKIDFIPEVIFDQ